MLALRCGLLPRILVVLAFVASAVSAQVCAQEALSPGYWCQGRWIGYAPSNGEHQGPVQEEVVLVEPVKPVTACAGETVVVEEEPVWVAAEVCPAPVFSGCFGCAPLAIEGRAEYLLWWTDGMWVPPLLTTSPEEQRGVIGQDGTEVLFGNESLNDDGRSGGRFTLGFWLDPCRRHHLEATYLTLGRATASFQASNDDFEVLARPFFDVEEGAEDAYRLVFPELLEGSMSINATTEFQGFELLCRQAVAWNGWSRVDFLFGWRWLQLNDRLSIHSASLSIGEASNDATIDLSDYFDVGNDFHGVELGLSLQRPLTPCWSLELLGKIAIGNTHSLTRIGGQTTTTDLEQGRETTAAGLLAQATNLGDHEQNSFATATEFGVTLRRHFCCGLEATVGYTFLYLSDVARAGDGVDYQLNLSQLPQGELEGAPRPQFDSDTTGFWAHGLQAGLECRF